MQRRTGGIEKFILDWLNKVTNDDSEFQKISSSKAVEKDKKRIKEVQSKKSELLGNKKATEHKLNNIMNIIESNSAPKSLLKRIDGHEKELKNIDNQIFKLDSEIDYLQSRSMTPDDLLSYLKELVPYLKEMNRERLRDFLHVIIKNIEVKKPASTNEKWQITINPWSYDPRAYVIDVLTGSCYRPGSLR